MTKEFTELYKNLNYKFKNTDLLKEALTHPSLSNILPYNYQRLEFVGDSVLSIIISDYLYKNFTNEKEGGLAKRRSSLVSGETISKIALENNLDEYILLSKGEMKNGKNNPKNLENCLEAIIGAVFYDSDFEAASKVVLKLWNKYLKEAEIIKVDPKTKLQEFLRAYGKPNPLYILSDEIPNSGNSPTYCVRLIVNGFGFVEKEGKTKKEAEKSCALEMLEKLREFENNK